MSKPRIIHTIKPYNKVNVDALAKEAGYQGEITHGQARLAHNAAENTLIAEYSIHRGKVNKHTYDDLIRQYFNPNL